LAASSEKLFKTCSPKDVPVISRSEPAESSCPNTRTASKKPRRPDDQERMPISEVSIGLRRRAAPRLYGSTTISL
jgi:hypothetical protein